MIRKGWKAVGTLRQVSIRFLDLDDNADGGQFLSGDSNVKLLLVSQYLLGWQGFVTLSKHAEEFRAQLAENGL